MPRAQVDEIELEYEVFGSDGDPPLLLISGLGAQLLSWDAELCEGFVDRGFQVIRYDNRDVGLSTVLDDGNDPIATITARLAGQDVAPPYVVDDMADDAAGLLDVLEIDSAHVVGASMGGMIAQALAIGRTSRVRSLTSIMSTTGDPDVGLPDPAIITVLMQPLPTEPAAAIERRVETSRAIGSPDLFDEERVRRRAEVEVERGMHPQGTVRQLLAIMSSSSRSEALRSLSLPAMVIHGDSDPLIAPSGGQRTHECLQDSELLLIEGMGHDLPPVHWGQIIEAVTAVARSAN